MSRRMSPLLFLSGDYRAIEVSLKGRELPVSVCLVGLCQNPLQRCIFACTEGLPAGIDSLVREDGVSLGFWLKSVFEGGTGGTQL